MEMHHIIYNISQDPYMSYENHLSDYAATGYIYLFSAQIAFSLKNKEKNLRQIYEKVFSNNQKINPKEELVYCDNFFRKNLPIDILS